MTPCICRLTLGVMRSLFAAAPACVALVACASGPPLGGRTTWSDGDWHSFSPAVTSRDVPTEPAAADKPLSLPAGARDKTVQAARSQVGKASVERKGKKYPTVWPAGRPVRAARPEGAPAKPRRASKWDKLRGSDLARELENYRKRMARQLKWKSYMIFQTKTILAIDAQRPLSRDALLRIPGLGAAKVDRFGDDILAYVRRHSGNV